MNLQEFLSKIDKSIPDGCWPWLGTKNEHGYGRVYWMGKNDMAHRVTMIIRGSVLMPNDRVLHTCDNPACCQPLHLFIGTQDDNMKDMVSKGRHHNQIKTHCPKGHEYTPDNIYWRNGTKRECRKCRQASTIKYNALR